MVLPAEFGTSVIPLLGSAGSSFGPFGLIGGISVGLLIGLGVKYDVTYFFPKGSDYDPDDEKDKKKKHPHGKYKDADYHHRQSRGGKVGKSCVPKNGQQALDNSVPVPGNTTRRIGVSCNEIVILDQTSEGLYHGHVRTWKELISGGYRQTENMKNVLVENVLVGSSGKILL
jgi:hypothetical protein